MSEHKIAVFDWSNLPANYAARYERLNANYESLYVKAAERLVQLAGLKPGDSAIDVGAGTGISTEVIAGAVGSGQVLAIDPSIPMLGEAAKKPALANVIFRSGGAEDLRQLGIEEGFQGSSDAIISSFTYYYTFNGRDQFYSAVHEMLRPAGRFVFNLTKYLGEMTINGTSYNAFDEVYLQSLHTTMQKKGIITEVESDETTEQFQDTEWEIEQLTAAGFKDIQIEAWQMPFSPSQAYQFTIDGFYSQGSRVTFLPGLMDLPTKERVALLQEALDNCSTTLDTYDNPHVANIVAYKTITPTS